MAATILAMTGPRKILELDGKPPGRWMLETGAQHLFRDELWSWEVAGCILCAENDNAENQTLARTDDDGVEHFHCLCHGELEKVPYSIARSCTVKIGNVAREFQDTEEDHMFFPRGMDPDERDRITAEMIELAQARTMDEDWLAEDE